VIYTIYESLSRTPPAGRDLLDWEAQAGLDPEELPFRVLGDANRIMPSGFTDFGTLPYAAVLDERMIIVDHGPGASVGTIEGWLGALLGE